MLTPSENRVFQSVVQSNQSLSSVFDFGLIYLVSCNMPDLFQAVKVVRSVDIENFDNFACQYD